MNRTLRSFLLFFSFLAFSTTVSGQGTLSQVQKDLLQAALNTAVGEQQLLPDYADLPSKKKIVLYDKMTSLEQPDLKPVYLTEADVPKLKKVKFELQNEARILDPTRKEDLFFIRVGQIAEPEGDYGIVTVMGQFALGTESRARGFVFKEAKGRTLFFKKENGAWKFDRILTTFPNLTDYKEGF